MSPFNLKFVLIVELCYMGSCKVKVNNSGFMITVSIEM